VLTSGFARRWRAARSPVQRDVDDEDAAEFLALLMVALDDPEVQAKLQAARPPQRAPMAQPARGGGRGGR
jgi:hypothetical protein